MYNLKKILLLFVLIMFIISGCQDYFSEDILVKIPNSNNLLSDKGDYYLYADEIVLYKNNPEHSVAIKMLSDIKDVDNSKEIGKSYKYLQSLNLLNDTSRSVSSIPFYRLYSRYSGDHMYTTSLHEISYAISKCGYSYEGIACYVGGPTALYRLYRSKSGDHFYTVNTLEAINAIEKYGYQYEGIACYINGGTIPFYRLYRPKSGDHFYTTSYSEKENAVINIGYIYEGIIGCVN